MQKINFHANMKTYEAMAQFYLSKTVSNSEKRHYNYMDKSRMIVIFKECLERGKGLSQTAINDINEALKLLYPVITKTKK